MFKIKNCDKLLLMEKFTKLARKRKISELSWNLTFRMTDLVLVTLFLGLNLAAPSKHTGKFLAKLFEKIHQAIDEEKIKQVFYQLKQQGLIDYASRLWQKPLITDQGRKRLKGILPRYDELRAWDSRLYLITYDIPEKIKFQRDKLRYFLKQIGCGLLQESVWVTPYNPKKLLKEYVSENDLSGLVLVSDLGRDGQIGEENIRSLAGTIFRLEDLNRRYREFINHWLGKKPAPDTVGSFFSILKDDPQLPFELLPDDWAGEQVWQLVKPLLKSFI
ncbi:MAG: hypothetical protein COS30_00530 [Candidatus Portnoybacteria bacterium CG02_land_8_20_14_3_00_45_8]|uniref:Transcriptional repressor PaaX-like central Cas2-like domain-containing protein n=1 Tax=Candidatus Portnoybacteria bacterium CG02_land_8_20_14_3_00_45_8 TaxID=1974807 RepID=A0A2M7D6S8_9BACT|nr:MAG: hypothetical protein COS30_00530 [Candidatus Portnoybacteria bacterium CG02_land_8_20_14_3_00_45_8]